MTPECARKHLSHYLSAYVRAIRRGLFPPTPADERTCAHCEFASCCRREHARIERKLGPEGRDSLLGLALRAEGEEER